MVSLETFEMLIDGAWVGASDGRTFESLDPASNEPWALIPEATEADVDAAVQAAHRAQTRGPWAEMTPSARGKCLARLGDLLAANSEALGRVETRDTGKMFKETAWQAKYIAEYFHFFAGAADKISGETLPIDKPDMFVFTDREPLGVVAAVIPWNSQMFLSAVKIAPALAAGNTIVLKASEEASTPLLAFGKLVAEAGIPDGVVNIVTGHGEPCGRALTSHPLVARVAFTGGPKAAAQVVRNTANNFAAVSLELGGKSPFIVFDDANLESAVNGSVAGIFGASGQSCVAGSRLFLQDGIADRFLEAMTRTAQGIRIGDPMAEETEMGPLCTAAQVSHIRQQVDRALEQGASLITGGHQPEGLGPQFFEPTIIEAPTRRWISLIPSCSGRCSRCSVSAMRKRRWRWPTSPSTALPPASSPATARVRCGWPSASAPGLSGSTPTAPSRRSRPLAVKRCRATAAKRGSRPCTTSPARRRSG